MALQKLPVIYLFALVHSASFTMQHEMKETQAKRIEPLRVKPAATDNLMQLHTQKTTPSSPAETSTTSSTQQQIASNKLIERRVENIIAATSYKEDQLHPQSTTFESLSRTIAQISREITKLQRVLLTKTLFSFSPSPNTKKSLHSTFAIEQTLESLTATREDLYHQYIMGANTFLRAAFEGNEKVIAEYIHQKINVNLTNKKKKTALHFAVLGNQLAIAEQLITLGKANVNAIDKDGKTPIMTATSQGNTKMKEMLIAHGGLTSEQLKYQQTRNNHQNQEAFLRHYVSSSSTSTSSAALQSSDIIMQQLKTEYKETTMQLPASTSDDWLASQQNNTLISSHPSLNSDNLWKILYAANHEAKSQMLGALTVNCQKIHGNGGPYKQ